MPKKQISAYDLLKDLSTGLRRSSGVIGFDSYEPMTKQIQFHMTDKRGRILSGGNRSGKTVGGIAEDVAWLTGKHPLFSEQYPPPVRGRIVGVDFDRGVDLILVPEVKKWIPPEFLIDRTWEKSYHKGTRFLTLVNGSTCEFMSYDQDMDKFAGTSRHFVHFDEEPPKDIFNECLARLIDTNGRWWLTLTPLIEFSWTADILYEPIREGELSNIELIEVGIDENIHIEAEAIEELTELMDVDEREARKTGSGYAHANLIFPELAHSDDHLLDDVLETESWDGMKKEWQHFTMMDHGLRNPTAILFAAIGPEGDVIVYDEYYHSDRLVGDNADGYLARVAALSIDPSYMVGDPSTRNTDPITGTSIRIEYGERGVWYQLGNNDVRAGIQRVKSVLKYNKLWISRRCTNLLREARSYKWAKPISSKVAARSNLQELPVKRNDHALDALRYGIMTIPKYEEEMKEERMQELANLAGAVKAASDYDDTLPGSSVDDVYDEHLGLIS